MTSIRIIPVLMILLCLSFNSWSQQLSLFTQYRENISILNPAAPDSDFFAYGRNVSFGASYRSQWVGLTNGPTTATLRGTYLQRNSGFSLLAGGQLINDQTGPTGFTGIYGRIGGVISGDPEYSGLSIGLSGGVVQHRINGTELNFRQSGDAIGEMDQSQFFPDVGFGAFFYTAVGRFSENYVYAGISVPQVIGLDLTYTTDNDDYSLQRVRHFYGMVGLYKFFDNGSFLEPSLWVKYVNNAPVNVDLNLRYQLPTSLWVGTGVSSSKTVHLETGVFLGDIQSIENALKIGYGFDYSFSSFGPTGGSTHELNITFSLDR